MAPLLIYINLNTIIWFAENKRTSKVLFKHIIIYLDYRVDSNVMFMFDLLKPYFGGRKMEPHFLKISK